jgi:DnaK suppressor protein
VAGNRLQRLGEAIAHAIEAAETRVTELAELTAPIAPENAIGRVSRMDAINNRSINEAALRAERQKLEQLRRASSRLHDPAFGVCIVCGLEIPIGRLMILPYATKCVQCS